jgi:hypothetical protein
MHPLVGDFPHPMTKLSVEAGQAGRLLALQAAQEIAAHILHTRLHFAFRLRAVRPAKPGRETPVAGKIQKHRIPNDLATLVRFQPNGFHAVVQNLFRNTAQLTKGFLMQAQQCSQLLIHGGFRHHAAAVAQREGKSP